MKKKKKKRVSKSMTEKHIKIKADGTKQEIEKKIYIGYIFIKMIMTNQSWFIVR
ncbi:MAG: transcription termination/antitermination NusG family protein, partial [Sweet potato little leaf phytoplasma]|nr:transcription termination/antitermination NusG family protein [Sweet potato little leaf phytoplasma]